MREWILPSRDRYRLELSELANQAKLTEEEAANAVLQMAEQARDAGNDDSRTFHVGYYLVGPGRESVRRSVECKVIAFDFFLCRI